MSETTEPVGTVGKRLANFLANTFSAEEVIGADVHRTIKEAYCHAVASESMGRHSSGLDVYLDYLSGVGDGDIVWSAEDGGGSVMVFELTESEPFGPGDVYLECDSQGFLSAGEYNEADWTFPEEEEE